MSYTEIQPLLEWLKQLDEVALIDVLGLTSEDIIDAFCDKILENQANLYNKYSNEL